jgi:S1-C subfamily serine protease
VSAQPAVRSESTSLGVVGYATDEGFKVTSVRDGSPAAQILMRGDVIWEIDGKRVRSGQDVDAALAANPGGTIKVKNENMIPSVREVKLR